MGWLEDVSDFFFGDDDVEVLQLAPEQQRLLDLQTQQLTEQRDLSKVLLPILLSEDYDITVDEAGNITEATPKDPTQLEKSTEEIQNLLAQKSLQGLRGELEVPEQVNTEFAEAREILEESLRKSLGPDFASSTPGQDALRQFDRTRLETLEGIRFAQLGQFEGLGLARAASGRQEQGLQRGLLESSLGVQRAPLAGFQQFAQQTQFDRALDLRTQQLNKKTGLLGELFGFGGQVAGESATRALVPKITKWLGG